MAKTANLSVRLDEELKKQAEQICAELGTSMSNAVNMFFSSMVRCNGFPFDVRLEKPNAETIAAMEEADRISKDPSTKRYSNLDELFEDLDR